MKPALSILLVFTLLSSCKNDQGIMIDLEGNQYPLRTYGQTIWMIENLRIKQDKLGNPIAYYFPDADSSNTETFGLLYDYETACKVCPSGWSLPTNQDWKELIESNPANSYKDSEYWDNEINSNSTSFSARPAGFGNNEEHKNQFNSKSIFWSNTKEDEHFVWTSILEKGKDSIRMASQHPTYAFSIRCIKHKN